MFDPTKGPGQITLKDCWISSTVIGIYLSLGKFPNVYIDYDNVVTLPNKTKVKLLSKPESELETVIRSLRVYFSIDSSLYQENLTRESLENYGSPDLVSTLLLGKEFKKYCRSRLCLSRIFYPYISFLDLKKKLDSSVMLCTFNYNPYHLYVILELKEENIITVIDVSLPDLCLLEINISEINIFMCLDL